MDSSRRCHSSSSGIASGNGRKPPVTTEPATERVAHRGIAAAAFLIMAGSLGSRVLGLVREQLTSGLFGAGNEIAAFTVADNVNTLLFDLMVSGMLEAALVPVLALWALPNLRE